MDKIETAKLLDENLDQIKLLIHKKVEIWYEHVLFSDLWWLGVFLSVAPWVLWAILHNKESTDRLLYTGFVVSTLSTILDILGDQLDLWEYKFNVIPVLPTYFPWDLTLMPVTVMTLIEWRPKINPFIKAVGFAFLASYIAEPFFNWLMIYDPHHWKYSYSFPLQFLLYLFAYWISKRNRFKPLIERT